MTTEVKDAGESVAVFESESVDGVTDGFGVASGAELAITVLESCP